VPAGCANCASSYRTRVRKTVRRRIAEQVAHLDRKDEEEALRWIEAVSEFDNDAQG